MHTLKNAGTYTVADMQPGDYVRVRMRWHEIASITINGDDDYYVFTKDGRGFGAPDIARFAKPRDFSNLLFGDTGI